MTFAWLVLAGLSALALALASERPPFAAPVARRALLRLAGWGLLAAAAVVAAAALGPWPGMFAALTAWMFVLVLLPLLGAAREPAP